ncbi:type III-A CRISPR-associated RAMP protein Csm5 [Vineibacter terrae]|uniref:CRISPR system Cms protein Csm5 n=1 Tax=Vineibacter terrae TaxID=2586908 RepID=A0A5C8PVK8_9HYPH|nr:type III-A CRISPR-associated RAMP protein Csm5 [Vineibacter terrae]TXL82055.1 type III-A CRISPR-associated RAMP protein Csm5 [Vineibacter terrae]
MTLLPLHAVAMVPVHVGDGSTWTPEAFRLRGTRLERFEPAVVAASLTAKDQVRFRQAVDNGELKQAQQLLHNVVGDRHVLDRIEVSPDSVREIGDAVANPLRAGRIHAFIRSGGRPFLPGSAVKGAIRTALLSARASSRLPALRQIAARADVRGGRWGRVSDQIQAELLGAGGRLETDADPFRFIRVADTLLPPEATRIEHVKNRRRDGRSNDMQMHFEALRAGTMFPLELRVDVDQAVRAARRDGHKAPGSPIAVNELLDAVDGFFRGRWAAEKQRFYARAPVRDLPSGRPSRYPILLRVGRFSHFESASIDGLRRGWSPQNRQDMDEGGTRAVVGSEHEPWGFGWLALFDGEDAARTFAAGLARAAAPAAGRRPGVSARTSRRATVDGEAVEVLDDKGSEVLVRWLDTRDTEWVSRHRLKVED